MRRARWRSGGPAVRAAVAAWLEGAPASVLHDNPRRRLLRLSGGEAGELLLKQFRVGSGRHPARDRLKAWIGRGQARREERALRALLVADNATKAALDAQNVKTNEARNALSRVRLDMLWDLRSVIPAQDREMAFRCAERFLMRGR